LRHGRVDCGDKKNQTEINRGRGKKDGTARGDLAK